MKTVLKDFATGLYFRHMDEWTARFEEAAGFKDALAALKFCQRNNLSSVAILQVFKDGSVQRIAGFHQRKSPPRATAAEPTTPLV